MFLALSVLGTLVLVRRSSRVSLIVLAWIVAVSLTTIAAAPMGYSPLLPSRGDTALWRAAFLTPSQIPVADGILSLWRGWGESTESVGRLRADHFGKDAFVLGMVAYFLQVLGNQETSYRPEFQSVADSSPYLLVISDQYSGVISAFARKEFRIRD